MRTHLRFLMKTLYADMVASVTKFTDQYLSPRVAAAEKHIRHLYADNIQTHYRIYL